MLRLIVAKSKHSVSDCDNNLNQNLGKTQYLKHLNIQELIKAHWRLKRVNLIYGCLFLRLPLSREFCHDDLEVLRWLTYKGCVRCTFP